MFDFFNKNVSDYRDIDNAPVPMSFYEPLDENDDDFPFRIKELPNDIKNEYKKTQIVTLFLIFLLGVLLFVMLNI